VTETGPDPPATFVDGSSSFSVASDLGARRESQERMQENLSEFRRQLTMSNLFFHRFKTYVLRNAGHWADAVCTGVEIFDSSRRSRES